MRHHICNFISHVWNLMIFDNWRFARCTSLTPRAAISFQPWRDSAYQKVEPRFEIWSDTRKFSLFLGHAFILVFSVASRKSLEELKPILELIAEVFSRFNPTWKWDVSLSDISQNQSASLGQLYFHFWNFAKIVKSSLYWIYCLNCEGLSVGSGRFSVSSGRLSGWVGKSDGWVPVQMGGYVVQVGQESRSGRFGLVCSGRL